MRFATLTRSNSHLPSSATGVRLSVDRIPAHVLLVITAFVPLLLTNAGRVAADTRQYFYVDPGIFMSRAGSLWDPNVSLGTVTHSNIGNLFPMGAFFWLTREAGIPAWVAQRLWIGLILFAAGSGVLAFARAVRWRGLGPVVAAFAYMLTPYTLQYATRTSVLLLPFAALPWTIALTERALRQRGWRHPAALALVAFGASGANLAAFLMIVPGAALWVALALARREVTWREVLGVIVRVVTLATATCCLWIVSLIVEGRYGLNVLLFTETLPQVAVASTAIETLRGLGYWLFYGEEARDPNVAAARHYLLHLPGMALSYALPLLAILSALVVKWRLRAFAIGLVIIGVVLGVGTYPFDHSSPFGNMFGSVAGTSVGLALRSSARAVPLSVLGLALLLGAGVDAVSSRSRRIGGMAAAALFILCALNLPALFRGGFVDPNFSRSEEIPAAWREAASALDGDPTSRVLELPGSQFAAYRWGLTYDTPILPTLLRNRPTVAREQTPAGSAASADLLAAFDRRVQDGTLDPSAVAPIARFLGVGDVLIRSDLAYERYSTARPRNVWQMLGGRVPGLGIVRSFGPTTQNVPDPRIPQVDARTLGTSASSEDPPEVAVRAVEDPQPIVRSVSGQSPVVLVGDGEGLVDAAAAGLVFGDELVLSAPWLASHPQALGDALDRDAVVVVTDTNRRRDRRWRSLLFTTGLTERPGISQPRTGQGEAQLDVFPGQTDDDRTVVLPEGGAVDATRYGGLITFDPDQRGSAAFDGDATTAWQVDDLTNPVGQSLTVRLTAPVTADHLDLLQSQVPRPTRTISTVVLTFDGGEPIPVALDSRSMTGAGQRIDFPTRSFSTMSITVTGISVAPEAASWGMSRTGFAEVRIPGVRVREIVRTPTRVTTLLRGRSLDHRLAYVLTRARSDPAETASDRRDEEPSLLRQFDVPDARGFTLTGGARLSGRADGAIIDGLLSVAKPGSVSVTSSDRLVGAIDQGASSALDGDPSTRWSGDVGTTGPRWLRVSLPAPRTIDHLDLGVVADGLHSVPRRLVVTGDDGSERTVDLPAIADVAEPGSATSVPVRFPPITSSTFLFTFDDMRVVNTIDTVSGRPVPLPPAIAELGISDVRVAAPSSVDSGCRSDLLWIDGRPVPIRIAGDADSARRRLALPIVACDGPVVLTAGTHRVEAAPGLLTGLDLDRLTFTSDAGGFAAPLTADGSVTHVDRLQPPPVSIASQGATSAQIDVPSSDEGYWLVLGESHSSGWSASLDGRTLGPPTLVDGYANGWWIPAGSGARTVSLVWGPQRLVVWASVVSGLGVLMCLVLMIMGRRRSDERPAVEATLAWPVAPRGAAFKWRYVLLGAGCTGLAGLILVGPVGALIGVAVGAVAVSWRFGRVVLAVAVLLLIGGACAQVLRVQHREHRPVRYDWARGYETESKLALTGLVLLASDPALDMLRRRSNRTERRSPSLRSDDTESE